MAKKKAKEPRPMQVWKLYEKKGDVLERKNAACLKCGPGTFLAKHKDRVTCGKCGYSEILKKEAPAKKE